MAEFTDFLKTMYNGHIGKIILNQMKTNEKLTHQVDMISGIEETNGSVRTRTIQLAQVLKAKNIKLGDIVMICAMNHKDAAIPFLTSMYLGIIPVNLAVGMTKIELKHIASLAPPKIIFTDPGMVEDIINVFNELKIDAEIVVFGPVKNNGKYQSFEEFSKSAENVEDFKCEEFDPENTTAFAVCSSGTTGLPKLVAITHRTGTLWLTLTVTREQSPINTIQINNGMYLTFSSMYWITGILGILGSPIKGVCRIQTDKPFTAKLACDAIEKYKPDITMLTPMAIYELTKDPDTINRDLSSLRLALTGGSAISKELVDDFQKHLKKGMLAVAYSSTEVGSISTSIGFTKGSVGKINPWIQWKIVDPETEEELGPNQPGELRVKTITMFQKYFNDPVSTAKAFDKDGYYKTGDVLSYDEEGYFFFIDRCKEMIKHRNCQISTIELENMINSLPEVLSTCVVGLPDPVDGELPMAFVQLVPGASISAQEIKNVIKESLSDYKQLRGGVVFFEKLPLTHSGKINRKAINALKLTMKGE